MEIPKSDTVCIFYMNTAAPSNIFMLHDKSSHVKLIVKCIIHAPQASANRKAKIISHDIVFYYYYFLSSDAGQKTRLVHIEFTTKIIELIDLLIQLLIY